MMTVYCRAVPLSGTHELGIDLTTMPMPMKAIFPKSAPPVRVMKVLASILMESS